MMMMSPPRCDWPVLLSVNPPPDWFDYQKQRKRWMGDSNLATVSVFTLFLPFSPRLCLTSRVFPSLLSFPLSFPPFLPLLRSGGEKRKGTYLNCQSMIVGMSQQGGKNEGIEAWNKGTNDKGEENEGELLVCKL